MVLPEAEADRDHEDRNGDDDPRAELVEVLDERQPLVEPSGPKARHALGTILGDHFALHGLAALGAALELGLLVIVVVVPTDRGAELANPLTERLSQLGKPLRPEDDESDYEDDQDLWESDVAWHLPRW